LATCIGSYGLLFPSATEMDILTPPSDLLILSSKIPVDRGLGFLVLLYNGTRQFSYIQIVRKVTWISNSCKVIPTIATFIVLWMWEQ
jgi:hypothetical protein